MINENKTYQVVVDDILHQIKDGVLSEGMRLPGERALALKYSISRASVREALSIMKNLGLVEIRQGEGAFISAFSINPLFDTISPLLFKNKDIIDDVLEFRRIIEVNACGIAVRADDNSKLIAIVDRMTKLKTEERQEAYDLDLAFHQQIVYLTKNVILIQAMNCIAYLVQHSITTNRKIILDQPDGRVLLKEHQAILKAIIDKDAIQAMALMEKHLDINRKKEIIS